MQFKRVVAFTSRELFPSLLVVAVCWAEKCSLPFFPSPNVSQVPKTSSYRTCVTFREKVVCRKCCRKLINTSIIVKRSLLYLFNY